MPEILEAVCGVQAQDAVAAALALRARRPALCIGDIADAQETERGAVTTWCMRGTLHTVASEDFWWCNDLFGPREIERSARRFAALDLTDAKVARGLAVIRGRLERDGPSRRDDLARELVERGVLEPAGPRQAIPHLIRRAALEGWLCIAGRAGGDTYVLTADWLGERRAASRPVEQNAVELARRYVAGFGPTTIGDFVAWSGLPVRLARDSVSEIADGLDAAALEQGELRTARAVLEQREVDVAPALLLGAYDSLLLGYRRRDAFVASDLAGEVHPGGGIVRATVLVEGRVVATWTRRGTPPQVTVDAPVAIPPLAVAAIADERADVERFLSGASSEGGSGARRR